MRPDIAERLVELSFVPPSPDKELLPCSVAYAREFPKNDYASAHEIAIDRREEMPQHSKIVSNVPSISIPFDPSNKPHFMKKLEANDFTTMKTRAIIPDDSTHDQALPASVEVTKN